MVYYFADTADVNQIETMHYNTLVILLRSLLVNAAALGQRVYLTENMHTEWLLVLLFICTVH